MTVESIMTREVVTVDPDRSLRSIQALFDAEKFTHLVVVNEKQEEVLGVITMRDLVSELSPFAQTLSERERDARTLERRAHQIMTPRPETCRITDRVIDAARLLLDLDVSSLPVLDENGHLAGILTRTDFITHFVSEA